MFCFGILDGFFFAAYTQNALSETVEEAILRSGSLVVYHTIPPTLITGVTYHPTWYVQSYVPLKSRLQIKYADGINKETVDGVHDGSPESAGYHIGSYYAYKYRFDATFTVPANREGIAKIGFMNTQDDGGLGQWMYGFFPTDVVDIPYAKAGKQFEVSICTPGVECKIMSPVEGLFQVVSSDQGIYGKWKFIQHKTGFPNGFHHSAGGIGGSDDTYAWDMNLNRSSTQMDTDYGRPVYAVAPGWVTSDYAGKTNAGGSAGQLLLQHDEGAWYSGYLHMENITVSPGNWVTQNTIVGYLGNKGAGNNHLHFVIYTKNQANKLSSFDADFIERERLAERRQ